MSVPASSPTINRLGSGRRLILTTAIAAVIAVITVAVWAIALRSGGQPVERATAKDTSALQSLTPAQQQYLRGLSSLSNKQIAAAFGTGR